MEGLQNLWSNLRLSEEEDASIILEEVDVSMVKSKGDLSLIGKIWCDRQLGKQVVESTMARIWRLSKPAVLKEVGRNVFVLSFATHANKERVEAGRPWFFDGQLFVIIPFDGNTPLQALKFDAAPFWMQFHNLPLFGMNKEYGVKLGGSIGNVLDVDVDNDEVG
ncbi:uncharacterized protein LOC122282261 [Carya illinoinensis]|uniref:uncharacterized protein LOC122282261 n=1 Tax=Carya illinoinensis TaxID=32201 RepID=UPI001C71CB7D|nr:uncharacterized protein LOC122282261 [Carya illinoinensis]